MNKELKAFQEIKLGYICGQGAINEYALRENERENFEIIKNAINDNYFYKYMISRICDFMGLDIKPFEDLVKTENEIINYICENECFRVDAATNKNKVKALDIIKEIVDFDVCEIQGKYYLITGNNYRGQIPISKEKYDLLKKVLL